MKILDIIKYEYGMTNAEAKNYIKNTDKKTLEAIKKGYNKQAKLCFYND